MPRYIDADKLLETYKKWIPQLVLPGDEGDKRGIETCIAVLEDQPTADVAEAKHGYWRECEDESLICATEFTCSLCKETFSSSELTDREFREMLKYCPNCGAKMDGKGDSE